MGENEKDNCPGCGNPIEDCYCKGLDEDSELAEDF